MSVEAALTDLAARSQRTRRGMFAGLSLHELRALLRGDPPTERPNPRYRAHVNSFLLHFRPRTYPAAATRVTHTWFLGLLAVLLFVVELVTGVLLMIFYAPTPEQAYASILVITYYTPFGDLLRDVHRLAAEAMVVVVVLHMARTFLTGSYKGQRAFTWLTGVLLLLVTLLLSFSGYLLPWDQLAYWAITIGTSGSFDPALAIRVDRASGPTLVRSGFVGQRTRPTNPNRRAERPTSMAQATPLIGAELNLLLRGAKEIGADGLLRFYLLHVLLLPLTGILLLAAHYYRVARHHGISLPAAVEEGDLSPAARQAAIKKIDFLPTLFLREAVVITIALLALVGTARYLFDAPLEQQANPFQTPLNTQAPWFFLWVQGLLKLGDKTLMGVVVPIILFVLLAALPYLDRNPTRSWRRRPVALLLALLLVIGIGVLSYMGTATYGITLPPAVRIAETLAPEAGEGALRRLPYDALTQGSYALEQPIPAAVSLELRGVLEDYARRVDAAAAAGELPGAQAFLDIIERQANLKEATLRIVWQPPAAEKPFTFSRTVYLHRERNAGDTPRGS